MFSKNKTKMPSKIDTLIGAGTRIEGNIHFSGGLRVDGIVNGDINEAPGAVGALVLSEQAQVEGAVTVSHLVLNGKVVGPVRANEFIELQPKSRIVGDVYYKSLEMHTGAVIEGKLVPLADSNDAPQIKMVEN
ncbi:bactofilin family protein [Methylobacillus flagellatus]|uniref:bactofilin family protein n=1 Tax=Methylobacillus flagellatus TaxID=405 RepID=UPI0010F870E5|nr:polymer-forming cytoskeletal protein [Methylobacillus flagellatus]